jgi:hypothetical protein
MPAFLDVKVQPIYGNFRALITWKVAPELAGGQFIVLKSPDGVNDWKPVTSGVGISDAIDDNLVSQGKLLEQYYKVLVSHRDQAHESPPIGTFGTVRRDEFGAARMIMIQEFQVMRRFTKLLLCKLRVHAPICSLCGDAETGQSIGTSLCETCFATTKEGGFFPPVVTYGRFLTVSPMTKEDSQEGTGSTDPSNQTLRMLAFPLLRKEDMLIDPGADRRYLVETTEYDYFGGKIPVVANVRTVLLAARDVRYKFPI